MKVGDVLSLVREPENTYDDCAIALYWKEQKIGFIPAANNTILAAMLDADDLEFIGEITHLEKETQTWENVAVAVSYLKKLKKDQPIDIVPAYLTTIEEPEYRTKKRTKEETETKKGILIPLTSKPIYSPDIVKQMNLPDYWIPSVDDFFEADSNAVVAIDEIPDYIKRVISAHLGNYDRITDLNGNEYLILVGHQINDLMYEIFGAERIEGVDGKEYIKGIFKNTFFNMEWEEG